MKTKKHCLRDLERIQRNRRDSSYPLPKLGYDYEAALKHSQESSYSEGYLSLLAYYNSEEWLQKHPRWATQKRRISICLMRMLLIDRNFKITALGRYYLDKQRLPRIYPKIEY